MGEAESDEAYIEPTPEPDPTPHPSTPNPILLPNGTPNPAMIIIGACLLLVWLLLRRK